MLTLDLRWLLFALLAGLVGALWAAHRLGRATRARAGLPGWAERRIALSIEADTPLPACLGDEDRLRQVFLNLLDNAIKYVRPGDRVAVALARTGEGVRCAVRDSGPGSAQRAMPVVGLWGRLPGLPSSPHTATLIQAWLHVEA